MSSPAAYSCPLQPYHVRNLILILRRANAHYEHVAAYIRASFVPTHHARKQARRLGLTVNIQKAVACDHRHVSVIPLPVIDQAPSPRTLPVFPSRPSSLARRLLPYQVKDLGAQRRPVLKCTIPAQSVAMLTKTSPNGTTSAISTSSFTSIPLTSPLVTPIVASVEQCVEIEYQNAYAVTLEPQAVDASGQGWVPLDVPIEVEAIDWGLGLGLPSNLNEAVDVMDVVTDDYDDEWEMSEVCDTSSASSASGSAYNSVSSASPVTPSPTRDLRPLTIRIKRKSVEVPEHTEMFKRAKFVGAYPEDQWAVTQNRNIIRIPARR